MRDLSQLYKLFELMCRAGSLEAALTDVQLLGMEPKISDGLLFPVNGSKALLEQAKINAACAWIHANGSAPNRQAYGDLVGKSFTRGAIQVTPGFVLSVLIKDFPDHLSRFLAQVFSVADEKEVVLNHFGEHVDEDQFQKRIGTLETLGMRFVSFDVPHRLFRRYAGVYDQSGRLSHLHEVFADDHMIASDSRVYHWDFAVPDPFGFLTCIEEVGGPKLKKYIWAAEYEGGPVGKITCQYGNDSFTIMVRPLLSKKWCPEGVPDRITL